MDWVMAASKGMIGKIRSRSSAIAIFSATASGWPLPCSFSPGPGDARPGWGVPSGPGEPAIEEVGVDSTSARRLRRLNGFCLLGVAITVGAGAPLEGGGGVDAEGKFCCAYCRAMTCACEEGSFGEPS